MSSFSLNELSDTDFEEFCFELLCELGFTNVSWRKGTGYSTSPADRGRDIECERIVTDSIDESVDLEKWFVECKHYVAGVPPDKFFGALTWAAAERPNVFLLIVSNHLSNPAKDFLEQYKRNNNPPFKIKVWERPQLEQLTVNKPGILRKHGVSSDYSFLDIMHPAHLQYIHRAPINTLDYFFRVFDQLDSTQRDNFLGWVYPFILMPRRREPIIGEETWGELYIDEVSYEAFKNKCYTLAKMMAQPLIVHSIVTFSLSSAFSIADKTDTDEKMGNHAESIEFWKDILNRDATERAEFEQYFDEKSSIPFSDLFHNEERIQSHISFLEQLRQDLPERVEKNYSLYQMYCDNVISQLLQEELL